MNRYITSPDGRTQKAGPKPEVSVLKGEARERHETCFFIKIKTASKQSGLCFDAVVREMGLEPTRL